LNGNGGWILQSSGGHLVVEFTCLCPGSYSSARVRDGFRRTDRIGDCRQVIAGSVKKDVEFHGIEIGTQNRLPVQGGPQMSLQLFLDTANVDEVSRIRQWGIIDGLTTNQKIFLREKGVNFQQRVRELLCLVDGPVSVEVTSGDPEGFLAEAREYASWGKNVVIKVPMLADGSGLKTITALDREGIKTNATIMMSWSQVFLAVKAGACYASLFYRRIMDCGEDADRTTAKARDLIDKLGSETKLIVGSIREPEDVLRAAVAGAHIVTVPPDILQQMAYHQGTEETAKEFDLAWHEFNGGEHPRRGAFQQMLTRREWSLGAQEAKTDAPRPPRTSLPQSP
jgi:transaldolase